MTNFQLGLIIKLLAAILRYVIHQIDDDTYGYERDRVLISQADDAADELMKRQGKL